MKVVGLLIKLDPEIKKEFKKTCKDLNLDMTKVIIAKITEFNKESKK